MQSGAEATFQYETRVVAFIDILGFRDLVAASVNDPDELERIVGALMRISIWGKFGEDDPPDLKDFRAQVFSDNILFSCPNNADCFIRLIGIVKSLAWRLMAQNCWVRGGVVVGSLFHSEDIVVGPSIVEAAELESNVARYPRIVLSASALKLAKEIPTALSNFSCIERDSDGVHFINHIKHGANALTNKSFPPDDKDWDSARKALEFLKHRYDTTVTKPSVFEKVEWVVRHWKRSFSDKDAYKDLADGMSL